MLYKNNKLIILILIIMSFAISSCSGTKKENNNEMITLDDYIDENTGRLQKITMLEAVVILKNYYGIDDIKLYSYNGSQVDYNGRSNNFDIVAFSEKEHKSFDFSSKNGEIKFSDYSAVEIISRNDIFEIDDFKDSPILVEDAVKNLNGKWPESGGKIILDISKAYAQVGSTDSGFSMIFMDFSY